MARIPAAAAILILAACGGPKLPTGPTNPAAPVTPTAASDAEYRVTGPYVHENLAVYLVHSSKVDSREYLTLAEGLEKGTVKVSEKEDAQVAQLMLENRSDLPLFIQEGDRVIGGKQDRIVGLSFVVPPKSGPQPIPAFCVEQGRWVNSPGLTGVFGRGDNHALANKEVRQAAKFAKDQSEVWEKVAQLKRASAETLSTGNSNSSLNETLEDPKVKKLCEAAEAALGRIAEKHDDAVGIAVALNGRIEEVDVYPGPALLRKMAPRLVQSYAVMAAVKREAGTAPAASEVLAFMKQPSKEPGKVEAIDARNRLVVTSGDFLDASATQYEGRMVHGQWMRR